MRNYHPNKYRNVPTTIDGLRFDSKAEARRYSELKLLVRAKEIQGFICQPSFPLQGGIRYRPDFMVTGYGGETWVEDVKGVETQAFKIKAKLWRNMYPWIELRVIK